MTGDIDFSKYDALVEMAMRAFSVDSSYALAVAKPAGALVSRRQDKEALEGVGNQTDSDV